MSSAQPTPSAVDAQEAHDRHAALVGANLRDLREGAGLSQ